MTAGVLSALSRLTVEWQSVYGLARVGHSKCRLFGLHFRVKTSTRRFFSVEPVLLMDDASEGAYDGGAVYVVVDAVGVRPVVAEVWDVFAEDIVVYD